MTIEQLAALACHITLKQQGHAPMWIAHGTQQTGMEIIEHLAPTVEGRCMQLYSSGVALGKANRIGELEQVYFIAEAWLSTVAKGETIERRPSEDPNRREALIINSCDVAKDTDNFIVYEIIRDEKGKIDSFSIMEHGDGTTIHSPLLKAFVKGFDSVRQPMPN